MDKEIIAEMAREDRLSTYFEPDLTSDTSEENCGRTQLPLGVSSNPVKTNVSSRANLGFTPYQAIVMHDLPKSILRTGKTPGKGKQSQV